MAMLLNEQVIAISGAQLEAVKQELINLFQEKRITFDGTPDVLLTTALDQVLGIAKGKCSIVDANTLPATTTPSTLYFVKTYNGNTKTVGRHLILTDSANASVYLGETSSESAANFVEKSQVVTSLGDSNYYYSFGDYLTKTIADGSVTLYSLTTDETGDITNITTLPMQGTLSGGVLTYNGNTYNHISEADGYYIVGYQNKVVAVSALRGLKAQGGSGGGGGGGSYTAGTGISITGDVISVRAPTLTNGATGSNSLAIGGTSSSNNSISVGTGTSVGNGGVAIGRSAYASGVNSTAIGFGTTASGDYSVVIGSGGRTSSGTPGACLINASGRNATISDPNTLTFANINSTYVLMQADGTIPASRLASTAGATAGYVLTLGSGGSVQWAAGGGGGGGTEPQDVSSQITNNLPDYIDYIKAIKTGGRIDVTVVTKGRSLGTTSPIIPKWTKIFTIGTSIRPTSALFVDKGIVFVTAPTSDISSATSGWAAKSSQVFVKSGTGQVWTMQDMNFSSGYNVMIPGTAMFSYYIA